MQNHSSHQLANLSYRRALRPKVKAIEVLGRTVKVVLLLAGGAIGPMPAGADAGQDTHGAGKTLGFVMATFSRTLALGADDCPDGFVPQGIDGLLANVSAAERARINLPKNAAERKQLELLSWNGELCLRPEWFAARPQTLVQGRVAYGMNLDGGDTATPGPNACAHKNFVSPDGAAGIDNQYYRVIGCMERKFRNGMVNEERDGYMRDGNSTNLIEVTGVDDLRDDDHVMVGLYAGADPVEVAAGDGAVVLPHATLEIDPDPRFEAAGHRPVRGRIAAGVLTTEEPIDFVYKVALPTTPDSHLVNRFRGGRLQMTLLADGTAKGSIAAYNVLEDAYLELSFGGSVSGDTQYFCPSFYAALKAMADGFRDPETGECTALSTAFDITAVPAFVIHPSPERFAAAAAAAPAKIQLSSLWERQISSLKEKEDKNNRQRLKYLLEGHEILAPLVERERARVREAAP